MNLICTFPPFLLLATVALGLPVAPSSTGVAAPDLESQLSNLSVKLEIGQVKVIGRWCRVALFAVSTDVFYAERVLCQSRI
uniref:Uncharacterized protein n=1 Tax=Moniliophthora roreri TaxID=221103 RepID=A0A0W0ETC8_MONRR